MKVLVSHPTGNANLRAVIVAFAECNILAEFDTTIASNPNSRWFKILPTSLKSEFARRSYPIESNLIHTFPIKEMARLGFQRLGFNRLVQNELSRFSVDAVYNSLDKSVMKRLSSLTGAKRPDAVYGYEDGSLATFIKARELGIFRIYDLPIGYWRAERDLLGKERLNRLDWAMTLTGFQDSNEKLERKDLEIKAADHIIVASSFTKRTLEDYPDKLPPVSVVPYGFPEVIADRTYNYNLNRKLRLLFVGSLSQRKGIAQVLEAVEALKESVELTLIGRKVSESCVPLNVGIQRNRYIPSMTHHEVLEEMRKHDILLFPSLFEGFGLVVTEAMSQGTPVITTNRTCGPDVIIHDENGWLIEAGSTDALIRQIKLILENPNIVESVGKAAIEKARTRPWSQYGKELVDTINSIYRIQI